MTPLEKLGWVEHLIESLHYTKRQPDLPEHMLWRALKSYAADLRSWTSGHHSELATRIGRRVEEARESGLRTGHMVGVAQEVIGSWSTIRTALESYEAPMKDNRSSDNDEDRELDAACRRSEADGCRGQGERGCRDQPDILGDG